MKAVALLSEILHFSFTMFRRDRSDRGVGGVFIAIKTASFKAVKEFKPESEAELQQLEIIFAKITTLTGQRIFIRIISRNKSVKAGFHMIADRRSQIAIKSAIVCDHMETSL